MASSTEIHRDATFSMETRANLELAFHVVAKIRDNPLMYGWDEEVDLAGAAAAILEVCDRWDANDATEIIVSPA